jgi:hypothetical protein
MQLNYFSPTSPYYDAMNTLEMLSKEVRTVLLLLPLGA